MSKPRLRLVVPTKTRPPAQSTGQGQQGQQGTGKSTPPLDDAQLLAAVHSGDEHAASELHDRLRPRVDATIRSLLGAGHSDHDDLAQHTFIELVLSLHRFRGECSLERWAATIAARTVFKFLR